MAGTRDYPLAGVLGAGNLIHHARLVGLLGKRIETRCGLEGDKTDRDGGIWCPDCLALERTKTGTRDERGGDEAAVLLAIRRRALTASTYAEWHQVGRDSEALIEQLAAATARVGKAEDEVERLRSLEDSYIVALDQMSVGDVQRLRERVEKAEAEVAGLRQRDAVQTEAIRAVKGLADCWRKLAVAPDAAPEALSEPVERSETSGGSFQVNTSSILPQGLSEPEPPRDTSAWCWAPSPHTLLHCGLLRDHKPPHRRGERTWIDDTTEDGQHG